MDEKTSELRDIFVETTGSETVTERQAESRGTLTDRDEAAVDERVREVVAAMRERYDFSTDLDDATYARIARGRFEADDDEAVAAALVEEREADEDGERSEAGTESAGAPVVEPATVRDARLDLHLVREADREVDDAAFDYDDLKQLTAEGRSIVECADALDVDPDVVAKYARIARVDLTSTRTNDRFRDELRDLLTDAEIEGSHAETARNDGLEAATEDMETDTKL
ncbi:hypothetical protein [Halorubrum kocurii]|uniref:Conditioned medium-induced protein 4 n=1 Tax=Halorubrum kocurii JCM 14978 TaxID=1230456 RepID=M0NYF5_9EURY|nr:hypothetical protein [Halorubrum kocurii]EMA61575.1 hypothetical protein C468_11910 [Halorubrum kocurii JCM 14978]